MLSQAGVKTSAFTRYPPWYLMYKAASITSWCDCVAFTVLRAHWDASGNY